MRLEGNAHTDVGQYRDSNEDCHLIDESLGLYIVCDGMGGHAAGEVASANATRITADAVRERRTEIDEALEKPGGHFKVVQIAADIVQEACRQLFEMAMADGACAGKGTTLTMLLSVGEKAILAHVGDSRLYLLRDGELHQLSNDHTLAEEFARKSEVALDPQIYERYSHVLTRSLGPQESVAVETLLFDVLPNDRFLLCSDGLSNYFTPPEEAVNLLMSDDFGSVSERLTDFANRRGGADNITSIVLRAIAGQSRMTSAAGEYLDVLRDVFLFDGLSLSRRMRLVNAAKVRSYRTGESIIREGDARSGLFVVVDGSVRMRKADGEVIELAVGGCFGETALARGGEFRIQASAATNVRLLHISRDAFRHLVLRLPRLGRKLQANLITHLSEQLDAIHDLAGMLNDTDEWDHGPDTEQSDDSDFELDQN